MILSYLDRLNSLKKVNFDSYKMLALESLSKDEQQCPWNFIPLRGKNIITTEKELDLYFAAYSTWHKGKLDFIFLENSDFILSHRFNLIDWGCGQGTATLALCDFLSLRNGLSNIVEVKLIEPSELAINRAKINIEKILPDTNLNSFNCYFNELRQEDILFDSNVPILHIFSNILDIKEIDKDKLAKFILANNVENNLFITSPFYYDAVMNIDYFENCFSDKTSNTYRKENKANKSDYTYYSKVISVLKDKDVEYISPEPLPHDKELLELLATNYNQDEYELFYKPFFIGYVPNIVLMRKNGGIMIFEVDNSTIEELEKQLHEYVLEKNEYRKIQSEAEETGNKQLLEQCQFKRQNIMFFEKIKRYKHIMLNMYKELSDSLNSNKKFYAVISCTVYFPNCSSEEIRNFFPFCKKNAPSMERIDAICSDTFTVERINSIFNLRYLSKQSKLFSNDLYESFSKLIKPKYHLKSSGIEINLSTEQRKIAFSNKTMKVKGVAGAGKTKVLAMRAVHAHKQTNDSVLIVTYNLTLKNYIKQRMDEIQEDFDWNFFHITNYHTLLSSSYVNAGKTYNKTKISQQGHHEKKYKTILIDEGQDFEYEWYQEIIDNFAEAEFELVIFADEKQNIYSRELDSRLPRTPIAGQWNKQLNRCFRSNKELVVFLEYMQKTLFEGKYEISTTGYQGSLFENKTKYIFREQKKSFEIACFINEFIKNNNLHCGDVCVLASRRNVIAELARELQTLSLPVNSLCPIDITKEDKNYETESRQRKVRFTLDNHSITLSTVHSFKGLEQPLLIILIDDGVYPPISHEKSYFSDELLYTALTRAKEEILVINVGNVHFDKIFKACQYVAHI